MYMYSYVCLAGGAAAAPRDTVAATCCRVNSAICSTLAHGIKSDPRAHVYLCIYVYVHTPMHIHIHICVYYVYL